MKQKKFFRLQKSTMKIDEINSSLKAIEFITAESPSVENLELIKKYVSVLQRDLKSLNRFIFKL